MSGTAMKRTTPVNLLIFVTLVWLPLVSAYSGSGGSASAVIQATARVVPSLGVSNATDKRPMVENSEGVDLSLWMTESDNLQVQVEADGRRLNFRMMADESTLASPTVLDRHRYRAQVRQLLQIDTLPLDAHACTITIVDPAN